MLNKVTLIGNLGQDPETRNMPNGGQVTNISLATTKRWKEATGTGLWDRFPPRFRARIFEVRKVIVVFLMSFLTLVVMNMDGETVDEINLTGLNNFSELSFWPGSDDTLVLKARPAASVSLRFNLYKVSRSTGNFEIWKTDRGMVELGHNISSDHRLMTYSK